jgi:signal transduction histidine kinase
MASATASKQSHAQPPLHVRESLRVRIASVLGTALVLGILVVGLIVDSEARAEIDLALLGWLALGLLASLATISVVENQPTLSMDLPVLLACSFVKGPLAAGLVALVGAIDLTEIRGTISPSRAAWNHAQVSLSVMVGGSVFLALGGSLGQWPTALFCATLALAADVLVNYVSVALMTSLVTKRGFRPVLSSMKIGDARRFALTYSAFGLSSLLMAEVYEAIGFVGVGAFVAPLLLAREAFRQTWRATGVERDLAMRRDALRSVDERIAEEREDERARIAEALHDDVLQSLFDVSIRAHVVRECYRSGRLLDLEAEVPSLISASERAAEELREVILGLRRSRIGHAGLIDTLGLLVAHLHDESGIVFVPDLDTNLKGPAELELLIYQVAREALSNAVKHAAAETVWISLRRSGGRIELEVLDNGVGFDVADPRSDRHFGIALMEERVSMASGVIEISSQPGSGVRISASFPMGGTPVNGVN